jgi:hypothetical protein
MAFRKVGAALAVIASLIGSSPASAYLFWYQPTFATEPSKGDEPGIGQTLPKATPAELKAHLLWNMRAGLNVAALQCQFSPILMTVRNYNDLISKNAVELNAAYTLLNAYFKRTSPKNWQTAFDQYTTKTYNGFSTMHAQLGFCETASSIGREARTLARGNLAPLAVARMREFRNSLVPTGDKLMLRRQLYIPIQTPSLGDDCWTKGGLLKARCAVTQYSS